MSKKGRSVETNGGLPESSVIGVHHKTLEVLPCTQDSDSGFYQLKSFSIAANVEKTIEYVAVAEIFNARAVGSLGQLDTRLYTAVLRVHVIPHTTL